MFKLQLTITLIILGLFLSNFTFTHSRNRKPPGTTLVKEVGYWIDKEEIKIADWEEFYFYIKKAYGVDTANTILPDTNLIKKHFYLQSYSRLTLKEKYKLPIIGVTFSQIILYCKFRTEVVNYKYKSNFRYTPLKIEVFDYLNSKGKKVRNLKPIGSNVPEIVILSNDSVKIANQIQRNINNKDNLIFGFRCIVVKN